MYSEPLTQQYKFMRLSRKPHRARFDYFRGHGPQLFLLISINGYNRYKSRPDASAFIVAGDWDYEHFHNCQMVISLTSKTVLKADRGRWEVKDPRYNRLTWAEIVDDITTTYDFSNMKWTYSTQVPHEVVFLDKVFSHVDLDSLTFLEWIGEYDNRPLRVDSANMLKLLHPELVPLLTAHHPRSSE